MGGRSARFLLLGAFKWSLRIPKVLLFERHTFARALDATTAEERLTRKQAQQVLNHRAIKGKLEL